MSSRTFSVKPCRSGSDQHVQNIEIVRKLANRLGITELTEFNDVVPLLFSHTAFKSYPSALIDSKRFDLMTKWLDKLTSHDLSGVDTDGCDSIDDWIDRLDEQTPLEVITSSGTTGTLSIIPKDKHGALEGMELWKICLFQTFGSEPTHEDLHPAVDVIWPNYAKGKLGHLRIADMIKRGFTGGDESKFHALYPDAIDTDLMFLASKMRAAASRGELDRLVIDPSLAARKDEFIAMQARQPAGSRRVLHHYRRNALRSKGFHDRLLQHHVRRRQGRPGSRRQERLREGFGDPHRRRPQGCRAPRRLHERNPRFPRCGPHSGGLRILRAERIPLGVQRGPLPRPAVGDSVHTRSPTPARRCRAPADKTGRAAVYDVLLKAHWGGVISGDEVTIDWDLQCPCGQTSVAFEHDIIRYSEKQGVDDDRITCAATHEVHNEAVEFMKAFES